MQCSLSSAIARLERKLVLSQAAEGLIRAVLAPYQRRFTVTQSVVGIYQHELSRAKIEEIRALLQLPLL